MTTWGPGRSEGSDLFDGDSDGSTCDVDCDDDDIDVYPGADEVCNDGIDNDCNMATPDIFDGDSDGVTCDLDCDDDEGAAYPGNTEVCNDGIDNDCNMATLDSCLFVDDFEDGDFAGWTTGSASKTRTIDTTQGANGTNMSFMLTGGNGTHYDGIYVTFPSLTPSTISVWVRSSSTSSSDGYVVFGGSGISNSNTAAFCYMKGDATLTCYDGSTSHVAISYSANTWYHLEFTIDWTNQQFDLAVDSTPRLSNVPFRGNAPTLQELHFYNYGDTTAWWDEVSVF